MGTHRDETIPLVVLLVGRNHIEVLLIDLTR